MTPSPGCAAHDEVVAEPCKWKSSTRAGARQRPPAAGDDHPLMRSNAAPSWRTATAGDHGSGATASTRAARAVASPHPQAPARPKVAAPASSAPPGPVPHASRGVSIVTRPQPSGAAASSAGAGLGRAPPATTPPRCSEAQATGHQVLRRWTRDVARPLSWVGAPGAGVGLRCPRNGIGRGRGPWRGRASRPPCDRARTDRARRRGT
jgi:hypothetical protein